MDRERGEKRGIAGEEIGGCGGREGVGEVGVWKNQYLLPKALLFLQSHSLARAHVEVQHSTSVVVTAQ